LDAEGGEPPVGQATLDIFSYSKDSRGAVEVARGGWGDRCVNWCLAAYALDVDR